MAGGGGGLVYRLRSPVEIRGRVVAELRFRPPAELDISAVARLIGKDRIGAVIELADRLAIGVPRGTVKRLPAVEVLGAADALAAAIDAATPREGT